LGEPITEDRKTRFVRYADWRFVNGVRMPFAEDQIGSNAADHKVQHATQGSHTRVHCHRRHPDQRTCEPQQSERSSLRCCP